MIENVTLLGQKSAELRYFLTKSDPRIGRPDILAMAGPGSKSWGKSATAIEFNGRRSPAIATRGMVASSQTLASEAGLRILRSGGNAFDAAVAVAAALNVCEPTSTGIGGDAFALCYHADSKAVTSVVGGGASPAALTLELCRERGHAGSEISPSTDALCVMVPGACAVWEDVVTKHGSGKLTLGDVFAPAIELAEGGAPIGPVTAELWRRQEDLLKQQGASCMLVDGTRAPRAGERKSNPELAATFRRVAEHGAHAGFYTGPIAEAIVNAVAERGGVLTLEDLAGHKTKFPEPLSTTYRDTVRVWELPPPNHGLAALLALNCLEAVLPGVGAPAHCRTWDHSAVESMKIAFADTLEHCGDPDHPDALLASLTPAQLIDKEYAKARVEACGVNAQGLKCTSVTGVKGDDADGEGGDSNVAGLRPSPDTVYFCVVDGDGNACSFINSNYDGFGTGIAPEGCGFTLQNRGHNFILREGHVNCVGPSKRPYHTIIPGMLTRTDSGDLFAAFGVMGGFMQPQGHLQVVSHMVDGGLDPQAALDMPRWCLWGVGSEVGSESVEDSVLAVEEGHLSINDLHRRGHPVDHTRGLERTVFGRGQVIARDEHGVLWGGSDSRGDGCAIGF